MINRNEQLLKMYKEGKTLEDLARLFNVTRSRIQQIVNKELEKEILAHYGSNNLTKDERLLLKVAIRDEVSEIVEQRKTLLQQTKDAEIRDRVKNKIEKIPNIKSFITLTSLARATNESVENIKKYFPEIATDILTLAKRKWSRSYIQCRNCGTTAIKHKSLGLCLKCFPKSEHFKELQKSSLLRNKDRRNKRIREYIKEYNKRPEVIEKHRKLNDLAHFGGNRAKVLARDGNKCRRCGLTQNQSQKKFGKDLYVEHLFGNTNHELNNLITSCAKCHTLKMRSCQDKTMQTRNSTKRSKISLLKK